MFMRRTKTVSTNGITADVHPTVEVIDELTQKLTVHSLVSNNMRMPSLHLSRGTVATA